MAEQEKKQDAINQVNDMMGKDGDGDKITGLDGKKYIVTPCSIADLSKLQKLFSEWQTLPDNTGILDDKSTELMGKIVHFGLKNRHPELTPEKCSELFSLGVFPKVLKTTMEINDFFIGMREINAIQSALNKNK